MKTQNSVSENKPEEIITDFLSLPDWEYDLWYTFGKTDRLNGEISPQPFAETLLSKLRENAYWNGYFGLQG